MGMAFTRKEWNKMLACTDLFCKVQKNFYESSIFDWKYWQAGAELCQAQVKMEVMA